MSKESDEFKLEAFKLPEHEERLDGTGMYPLKEPLPLKPYFLTLMLPAAFIHLLLFAVLYALTLARGTSGTPLMLVTSIPPLLLAWLFLLLRRKNDISVLGKSWFTRYERGRRFVISLVISLGASGAFLYYAVMRWQLFSLPLGHVLLAAALICGNLLLTWMPYELASYIMFGVLTWLVGVVSFTVLDGLIKLTPWGTYAYIWLIPQTISFILCVLFAYLTNRAFVFTKKGGFFSDMIRFFGSRIVSTLVFEVLPMYALINILDTDEVIAKFVGAFLVTIANYFISKFFVFRGGTLQPEDKRGGRR